MGWGASANLDGWLGKCHLSQDVKGEEAARRTRGGAHGREERVHRFRGGSEPGQGVRAFELEVFRCLRKRSSFYPLWAGQSLEGLE